MKRVISIFLCLVILCSTFSIGVNAEEFATTDTIEKLKAGTLEIPSDPAEQNSLADSIYMWIDYWRDSYSTRLTDKEKEEYNYNHIIVSGIGNDLYEPEVLDLSSLYANGKEPVVIYYGSRATADADNIAQQSAYYELCYINKNKTTETELFTIEVGEKIGEFTFKPKFKEYSNAIPDSRIWIYSKETDKFYRVTVDGISSFEKEVVDKKFLVKEKIKYLMGENSTFQPKDKWDSDYREIFSTIRSRTDLTPDVRTIMCAKAVYEYLINTIIYGGYGNGNYKLYGPFIERTCVCAGYSAAFIELMTYLGEGENVREVVGMLPGIHAWNKIKVNGEWYHIDPTWGDGISSVDYFYFMKSDEQIGRAGILDEYSNDTTYDSMIWDYQWEKYNYNATFESTQEYSLSFNTNGGNIIDSQTVVSGQKISTPVNLTKTGYIFAGWYDNAECTGQEINFDTFVMPSNDTTLYAKWNENKYNIKLNANGGLIDGKSTITLTDVLYSESIALSIPQKACHTFVGWYDNNGNKVENTATQLTDTNNATITLTARWNESNHNFGTQGSAIYTCSNCKFVDNTKKITANVAVGDIITYTCYLKTPMQVVNGDFNIYYTSSTLELVEEENSVRFPLISYYGYFNTKQAGVIKSTFANISSLIDFTKGGYLCKLAFRVINTGDYAIATDISLLNGVNPNGIKLPEIALVKNNNILNTGVTVTPNVEVTNYARRELAFKGASLTIQNNIAVNYAVDKIYFEKIGYTNPYVIFNMNGQETKVTEFTKKDNYYIFTFKNLAPNLMNDNISATLFATYNGKEYSSNVKNYSISQYCYSILTNYSNNTKLRTLIVDLLNYGAMAQNYTGYNVTNLVNAKLTDAQKAFATTDDKIANLNIVTNPNYKKINNASLVWQGANLNLQDSISIQTMFTVADKTDVIIKVTNSNNNVVKEISSKDFSTSLGYNMIKFNGLFSTQLSDTYYFTAYKNNIAISNTLSYSVESYAKSKIGASNTDAKLENLMKSIMKYGYSSRVYSNLI